MKIKEIRDLIDYISQSDLNEVNIETADFKIAIKKKPDVSLNSSEVIIPQTAPKVSLPAETPPSTGGISSAPETPKSNLIQIKSPMIGSFYRAANPEAANFVEVGDRIKPGQTLCVIEAMKLFNEIESEISGTIVEILVDNASPIEFDQPLFLVDPS